MNKKKSDKFDRFGKIDKEHDSHSDSQEAMEDDNFSESSEYSFEKIQEQVIPIAAFHHSISVLQLTEREDEIMVGDSQIWGPTLSLLQSCGGPINEQLTIHEEQAQASDHMVRQPEECERRKGKWGI
jgi:hypothetical protein